MNDVRRVLGIEGLPFFVIAGEFPKEVDPADWIEDVPLPQLFARLKDGDVLYLVDQINQPPGYVKLVRLT